MKKYLIYIALFLGFVSYSQTPERGILYKIKPAGVGQKVSDAEDVEIDASGFDGNLSTTDNDVQKVAQKT